MLRSPIAYAVIPPRSSSGCLCAALLVAVAGLSGCQHGVTSEAGSPPRAVPVETPHVSVVAAEPSPWPRVVQVQGSLLSDEHAVIGAKVAGRIKRVLVDLGATVAAGETLAELETEDFDLQVQEAEAALEQVRVKLGLAPGESEKDLDPSRAPLVMQEEALRSQAVANLERAKTLAPQKVITAEELGQKQADLEVAEARCRSARNAVQEQLALIGVRRVELALAKRMQVDAVSRAPFAGVIQHRQVAPGTYVQVGQPIVSLVRTDPLRFHAGVPERQATQLAGGQAATIRIEGVAEPIRGQVSRISPSLDPSNRSLLVEIDVPNPGSRLRVGLFAEAEIIVDPAAQTLAIPAAAVREFAGVEKVWIVQDGQAAERVIVTGRRAGQQLEVLRGLQAGDLVVARAEQGQPGAVVAERPAVALAGQAGQ